MKNSFTKRFFKNIVFLFILFPSLATAQLNTIFQEQFDNILRDALKLSPFGHDEHFIKEADRAAEELSPALNSLIANNISSFPLSSTSAGVTFDFSSGRPQSITESLGPIFAETGRTLGKGKLNFGFNYTILNPTKIRGLATEDIRFSFFHEDLFPNDGDVLGINPTESDILDVFLGLNLDASIFAFYVTTGLTNRLDLSVAVPLVNLTLKGDIQAKFQSYTFASLGRAFHHFGETDDLQNFLVDPALEYNDSYSDNAAGLGDLAIRLKYGAVQSDKLDLAFLLDTRLPTGDETNFLGTGAANVRFSTILSSQVGGFRPHLNAGYEMRGQDNDSDEVEFAIGFDQKIASGITVAVDILGEIDVQDDEANELLPGFETVALILYDSTSRGQFFGERGRVEQQVDRSNIPDDVKDHVFNAAFGFRFAPSERVQLLTNLLVPINAGGLRPDFAITLGLALTL